MLWKKLVKGALSLFGLIGVAVGLLVLYPWLAINEDYASDFSNPYNASFSVTNEGYVPLLDLSATCTAGFEMLNPGSPRGLPLKTTTTYEHFAPQLKYKHRASIPCDHNVLANGHLIKPGATLTIQISYRLPVLKIRRHQEFHFWTQLWWDNTYHWKYDN